MDQIKPNQQQNPQHHGGIDDQQTGFMVGAVLGALVGGAAALLLSPKSGKEMREIVKKYSKELEAEAFELAKESRGVATSFKSVLEEGANEVVEQAPQRIEQAGYQAQQLADDLSHRFESARDVVSELAEAFRSGWDEYGEEHPADEFSAAAPALFAEEHVDPEPASSKSHDEPAETPDARSHDEYSTPLQSRRRGQVSSGYSLHSSQEEKAEKASAEPKDKSADKKPEPKPATTAKPEPKTEEKKPDQEAKPKYETRILEKPTQVKKSGIDVKLTEEKAKTEKAEEKPRKKLLFRRSK